LLADGFLASQAFRVIFRSCAFFSVLLFLYRLDLCRYEQNLRVNLVPFVRDLLVINFARQKKKSDLENFVTTCFSKGILETFLFTILITFFLD